MAICTNATELCYGATRQVSLWGCIVLQSLALTFCRTGLAEGTRGAPADAFHLSGTITFVAYDNVGNIQTNYDGTFEVRRSGSRWSTHVNYLSTGSTEDAAFDGTNTFVILRNSQLLTEIRGKKIPIPLDATKGEDGKWHSNTASATIMSGRQPDAASFFSRSVWITYLIRADFNGPTTSMVLPWSVPIPGGVQRFTARPISTWRPTDLFPAEVEFRAAKESREQSFGSTRIKLKDYQFSGRDGKLVGRLQISDSAQSGSFVYPSKSILTRYIVWPGSTREVLKERYELNAQLVGLDTGPIVSPTPEPVTSVTDARVVRKGIPIAVQYNMTNRAWLLVDDPELSKLVFDNQGAYLAALNRFAIHSTNGVRILILFLVTIPMIAFSVRSLAKRKRT